MKIRSLTYRTAAAGALGLALAGSIIAAGSAGASTGANIDQWRSTWCVNSSHWFCMYYSPDGQGGSYYSNQESIANLSGHYFSNGDPVRNDAASIGNGAANCPLTTWVYTDFTGDWNWVHGGYGGNLTSSPPLRNNEASIKLTASNCY